ncbi:PPC domain-containing DNA-binding protein [Clostridium sp. JNZ J1-5]
MKLHAFRLYPGEDLKKKIEDYSREKEIKAAAIITCVGSLTSAHLRLADENIKKKYEEKFEIVSLVGTISEDGCHLHISIADSNGKVIGGHLLEGCIIYTTAEVIIGEIEEFVFVREYDDKTGFDELKVKEPYFKKL